MRDHLDVTAEVPARTFAVVKHKHFAVSVWVQRATVDIEIALKFDGRYAQSLALD